MNASMELNGHACKRLYLYIVQKQRGNLGYFDMTYYDMAYHLGLPWSPEFMVDTVRALRCALERLMSLGLICIKPSDQPGSIRLLLRVSPRRAEREHGPWWIDDLLADPMTAMDPWVVLADNG